MGRLLHLGDMVSTHARLRPDKVAARDSSRSLTYHEWNRRAARLGNALVGLGLRRGDRVAVLAYNRIEWVEIYVALAKAGLVAVPINFRLTPPEMRYIIRDAAARAVIVEDPLVGPIEEIRADLEIDDKRFVHLGGRDCPTGYQAYENLLQAASDREPGAEVAPDDAWAFMYTSGTTGLPKGAMRSHGATAALAVTSPHDFDFTPSENALLVMQMFQANSLFFFATLAYAGATVVIDDHRSFDPEHVLRVFAEDRISFTSLVPTQYIMMLGLSDAVKRRYDVTSISKLLISSAPARRDTKLAILDLFTNSSLYEGYGSTEAGWVTVLRPDDQLTKLGSIGRECFGSGPIRLVDDEGNEVPDGEVGELYSYTPYSFTGYWNLPDKTGEAFRGGYCSVGDTARRDPDGFYYFVGRKKNMIITGGEKVYPAEVENVLGSHPKVKDVAVVGVPDDKWGESVFAVVVPDDADGAAITADELVEWSRGRLAGYKRPRGVAVITEDEMPRTATGKIQHHLLRERFGRHSADG
jgi:acyl-CoA synthetase (AMP-forming)/AMP-acid ligase II